MNKKYGLVNDAYTQWIRVRMAPSEDFTTFHKINKSMLLLLLIFTLRLCEDFYSLLFHYRYLTIFSNSRSVG